MSDKLKELKKKLRKASRSEYTDYMNESDFFDEKLLRDVEAPTEVPMLNVALSGSVDGGLRPGFTQIAGPSKHFKTSFALVMAKAWQKRHPDSVIIFYDTEFGAPQSYFNAYGIDTSRVMHVPIANVEELKTEVQNTLEQITRDDKVMILIDSIGNMASKKEADDAADGKVVADMTRAKSLKSFFRIVMSRLRMLNIPMVGINHTYETMELYSKSVPGGGKGAYYAANDIWIISRRQEKDSATNTITGYQFTIKFDKSRFLKEGSSIPIRVSYEGGIDRYSGIFELALEAGLIQKATTQGWYHKVDLHTGIVDVAKIRKIAIEKDIEYLEEIINAQKFKDFIEKKYRMVMVGLTNEPVVESVNESFEETQEEF